MFVSMNIFPELNASLKKICYNKEHKKSMISNVFKIDTHSCVSLYIDVVKYMMSQTFQKVYAVTF